MSEDRFQLRGLAREALMAQVACPRPEVWLLFGIGMMRRALGADRYLHVFDDRFAVESIADVHNHEWDYRSDVVVGTMRQQRYFETRQPNAQEQRMHRRVLPSGPVDDVSLWGGPEESYRAGATYYMEREVVHRAYAAQGTVTILTKTRTHAGVDMTVYWPRGCPYAPISARHPRSEEVRLVCDRALREFPYE